MSEGHQKRPEGSAANRSTRITCSQWHAVGAWPSADCFRCNIKTDFQDWFPWYFAAFKAAKLGKLVCTGALVLLNQRFCRKYSYTSDREAIDSLCLHGSNSGIDTDAAWNFFPPQEVTFMIWREMLTVFWWLTSITFARRNCHFASLFEKATIYSNNNKRDVTILKLSVW